MKAIVMSIFLFMNALSSALAQALAPAIKDPYLTWVWAGPAIAMFVISVIFLWRYSWANSDASMTAEEIDVDSIAKQDAERKSTRMQRQPEITEAQVDSGKS